MPPITGRLLRVLPAFQGAELHGHLLGSGWSTAASPNDVERGILSTWVHPTIDARVTWAWLEDLHLLYGVISGRQTVAARAELAAANCLVEPEQAIGALQHATTIEHLCHAAGALAVLACGPFEPTIFAVLNGMLSSESHALRMHTLQALQLTSWREFEEPIYALIAQTDTDPELRDLASDVLQGLVESSWNDVFA